MLSAVDVQPAATIQYRQRVLLRNPESLYFQP